MLTIVSHRGNTEGSTFRENALDAFRHAKSLGFDRIECDVWFSADGDVVVIHDHTLDRTTEGHGEVSRTSTATLRQLGVPLLSDVRDLVNVIEIKPADAKLVEATIRIMSGRDWLIQSFQADNIRHARRVAPNLPHAFLADDITAIELAEREGWHVHANHKLLADQLVRALRHHGLRVGAWTVNEESDIRRILALDINVIITDVPQRVLRLSREPIEYRLR